MLSQRCVKHEGHTAPVDESTDRVWNRIDAELRARRKGWPWLRDALGYSEGRVGNWKGRGIPTKEHVEIARVMDESVDWLLGLSPPKRHDLDRFSTMARKLAQDFDTIRDDEARLGAFAACISVIARARGA